jgi:hypothetical protein
VLKEHNLTAIRADQIAKPGHITKQTVEHIAYSRVCTTDLSFANQNAHYELGVRHAFNLASVQIIRKGDRIPFDVHLRPLHDHGQDRDGKGGAIRTCQSDFDRHKCSGR